MRLFTTLLATSFLSPALSSPLETHHQQPLQPSTQSDLIDSLKKAEIIPTVLSPFHPYLTLNLTWPKKGASAQLGNTLKPKRTKKAPTVHLVDTIPDLWTTEKQRPQLTLAMTDPDARSRENPDWSEMLHWLATDFQLGESESNYTELVPYKAPGPPKKTGKHRYVFAVLAPVNGTLERLNLNVPSDRQHWGYGEARTGLRRWADENGLKVVGANFIYAQHKKQ